MTTEGLAGFYIETRNYGATASFWRSLGFELHFETDHGSGQWQHPKGGPYIFISERGEGGLESYPILSVADSEGFVLDRTPGFAPEFTPQHWDMVEALVLDPDGRKVSFRRLFQKECSRPTPMPTISRDTARHEPENLLTISSSSSDIT